MAIVALEITPRHAHETAAAGRVCALIFWSWLTFRTVMWTMLATVTQSNAPLDLIEWLAWGREWQWGYHKHPPLPAWIAEISFQLAGRHVWGVYLASYLCTAICLWCVWKLGRALATPPRALLAALALEGLIYFTYDTAEFNNNVVLNALWALTILCVYFAARTNKWRWWLLAGVVVGLGFLCKYTMAVVMAPLVLFVLLPRRPRTPRALYVQWRRQEIINRPMLAGVALMSATAFIVFLPHLIWMVRHDFGTITYSLDRSAGAKTWWTHITNPLLFSLSQLGRLLPLGLMLVPLTGWAWRRRRPGRVGRFNRDYLAAAVLGPVALLLLLSLTTGIQLREIWGSPLWTYAALLLLVTLKINSAPAAWRWSWVCWGGVTVLLVAFALAKNCREPNWTGRAGRVHFMGQELAAEATRRYLAAVGEPFPIVAGECWLAGNVSCYAPQRPSMYSSGAVGVCHLEPKAAPWVTEAEICRRGGVLLWDARQYGDELPEVMRQRFPQAETQTPMVLPYARFPNVPPERIGMAIQRPADGQQLANVR